MLELPCGSYFAGFACSGTHRNEGNISTRPTFEQVERSAKACGTYRFSIAPWGCKGNVRFGAYVFNVKHSSDAATKLLGDAVARELCGMAVAANPITASERKGTSERIRNSFSRTPSS